MAKLNPLLKQLKSAFGDIAKAFKKTPSKTSKDADTTTTSPAAAKNTDTSTTPSTTKQPDTPTNPASTPDTPSKTTDNPDTPGATKPASTPSDTSKLPDQSGSEKPDLNKTAKQTIDCGDPVDVATGEFLLPATDIDLPGVLALVLTRRHRSSYRFGRWFGPSWAATLDMRVEVDQVGVRFVGPDGELWQFPHTAPDVPVRPVHQGTRATMTRAETGGYSVHDPDRELTWSFRPTGTSTATEAPLGNYPISEITDRHHNRITFHYTSTGQPAEVTHSGGYRVRIDANGSRITGLTVLGTTPEGDFAKTVVREFGYTAGDLASVANGVAATTTFRYDEQHRMLSWRDSRGTEMHNTYDRFGRVIKQVGTDGILSATFAYEPPSEFRRSRTHHTNSLGSTTVFEFDEDLRLRNLIDPRGATSLTDYNEYRQPVRHVDAYSNTTVYLYNADGDLVLLRRPDQATITVSYAAPRRPATITDVDGTTTTRTYDGHGNLTRITDADGVTTTYTHHPSGAPASMTRSTGATTSIDVDAAGLPITITEPGNAITIVERDMFGRPVTITDPLGNISTNRYSAEGKLLSRNDADGATQVWTYDGEANLLTHANQIGAVTRYVYSTFDLVSTRETADGAVTSYTHDTERRLTSVTNPLGDTWTYEYDSAGNLCTETDYNGSVTHTDYDLLNRPIAVTTPTGVQRRLTFDILGRFTGVSTDTGEWITNTYTPAGQLATARNGVHADLIHSVTFTHTPAGRVLAQHVDGRPVIYDYDEHGRRSRYTTPSGASTSYERTPTGQVAALTADGHRFDLTHDPIGRQNSWHSTGIGQHNTYSPTGHILSRELVRLDPHTSAPSQLLERDEYAWRPDGYVTSHVTTTSTASRRRDYSLDVIGRITDIAIPNAGVAEQYSYDALSNLLTTEISRVPAQSDPVVLEHNPSESATDPRFEYRNNLLVRAGRTRYHYDTAGRLIRKEKTRISRKPAIWHYRYNAFDQLTEVTTPDKNTWSYSYDPFGRRTSKQNQADNIHTDFAWDGLHLTEQTTTDRSGTRTHTWTNHPTTHVPLTQSVDGQFWAICEIDGDPMALQDFASSVGARSYHDWPSQGDD
ncbi:DUF6531 domain-containing protein [Nocardia sp. XZ_19_231]|uniref:DUF6531 domain-containing protein n=1 Tax=Nocardia sp. XZ_19_231 TaxID=2769252 RepID=UPI00188E9EB0|nr:DUF6531 domain-containing protein [Nocardia sp. XZ_19_231]